MKTFILFVVMIVLLFLAPQGAEAQVPRRISYQGILTTSGGIPLSDGAYRIQLNIYDTSAGGGRIWSELHDPVNVSGGTFQAILGSINPLDLPFDKSYYLEVMVIGGPGISSTITLAPRTELTSSPYAIRAEIAEEAAPRGTAGGDLTGAYPNPSIANSVVTGAKIADSTIHIGDIAPGQVVQSLNGLNDVVFLSGAGGATVTSQGDSIIISASGGGGSGIQGVQNTNSTLDITNPNGPTATINLKLPLSGSSSTSGTTLYMSNLANGVAISGSSVNNDGMTGSSANSGKSGIWGNNTAGGYGVAGSTGGSTTAGVWGSNSGDGYGVKGTSIGGLAVYGQTAGTASSGVFGDATSPTGSGYGVYGRSVSITGVGVYGTNTANGHAIYGYMSGTGRAGLFEVNNASNTLSGLFTKHNGMGNAFASVHTGTGRAGYFEINNASSNATALYVTTNGTGLAADFNGNVAVKELQINGGADMAEPFEIEDAATIEPGTVMILNPSSPGHVLASATAYDKKVAGVVSGAGGIRPGLTLRQQESSNETILVAIAGRVYCKSEAISSPIEVGDLLTTSDLPGYAMKAIDPQRSHGAIIGKAMSRLENGKGLVLVLVNLQ